ncbi:hypothetical protein JOD64_004037 [Micromonospora luteifusca]|uniref:Uncharacterized protein n=1 Tax=Micromonospora luteifusca TaxID=709860 RepID=A0ABS2LXA1_9ACTN|nr:hypothetical protein [Micromonospora luteifusca]
MPVGMPDLHEKEVALPNLRDRRFTRHSENGVRILSVRGHDVRRISWMIGSRTPRRW